MNIHFGVTEKLDPYWGIGVGYKSTTWKFTSDDPDAIEGDLKNPIPLGFETTIGVRYYFTPNIGLYTEMGLAKSAIQVGLAMGF